MNDYLLERKRRSVTSSPVGGHKPPSTTTSNFKATARLKHHHNTASVPMTSSYIHHHHHHNHVGLTPEGENMERKVKEALMTELTSKSKPPSGKSESSVKSSHRVTENSRLHSKSTVQLPPQIQHQGHRGSPASDWPGEDFHVGSNTNLEMTPEPPSISAANNKLDVSEFDPIVTKNK